MNIQDWTIQKAIEERVQREDMFLWAQSPNPKLPTQKPLQAVEWSEAVRYAFGRGVYYVNCLRKI